MDSFLKNAFIVCLLVVILSVFGVEGAAGIPAESSTQTIAVVLPVAISNGANWQRVALGSLGYAECPHLNQTWKRNGTVVARPVDKERVYQGGAGLNIPMFQASDVGRYDCVSPDGIIGYSHIFYQDISFSTDTLAEQEVPLGSIGSIACQVLGSDVAKSLFRVENAVMTPVTFVNGNFEWTRNVAKSDAGEYICRGTQVISGDEKSIDKNITLLVEYVPEIANFVVVVSGDYPNRTITLSCPVDAAPPAVLKWSNVPGGSDHELQDLVVLDGNLTLPFTNQTDNNVTCTATNAVGSSSRVFHVPRLGSRREDEYPNVTSTYNDKRQSHNMTASNGTTIGPIQTSPATNAEGGVPGLQTGKGSRLSAFFGLFLMVVFAL